MLSLHNNNTWKLVEKPANRRIMAASGFLKSRKT